MIFNTSFTDADWHNFAVVVDWTQRTLQVLYSANAQALQAVTDVVPNTSAAAGAAGQGEFHFGVLKVGAFYFSLEMSENRVDLRWSNVYFSCP